MFNNNNPHLTTVYHGQLGWTSTRRNAFSHLLPLLILCNIFKQRSSITVSSLRGCHIWQSLSTTLVLMFFLACLYVLHLSLHSLCISTYHVDLFHGLTDHATRSVTIGRAHGGEANFCYCLRLQQVFIGAVNSTDQINFSIVNVR